MTNSQNRTKKKKKITRLLTNSSCRVVMDFLYFQHYLQWLIKVMHHVFAATCQINSDKQDANEYMVKSEVIDCMLLQLLAEVLL